MQVVSWPHLLQSTSNIRGGSSCDGSRLASGEREGDGSDEGARVDLDLVGGGDCQEAGQQGAASIGGGFDFTHPRIIFASLLQHSSSSFNSI